MRTALHDLLKTRGKSQSELARLIGKTPSFVNRLASGKENASKDTIDAVIAALGATYEEAFGAPKRKRRAA